MAGFQIAGPANRILIAIAISRDCMILLYNNRMLMLAKEYLFVNDCEKASFLLYSESQVSVRQLR